MSGQQETEDLKRELARLADEVEKLNAHRFIRIQNSVPQLIAYRFASGLAMGLGTVLGGTILLSFIVLALGSIDFIPVIGEWAARVAEEMNAALQ